MAVVSLPGHVIADSIAFSRQFALQSPPVEKGCFLQTDTGVLWSAASNTVTAVNGAPLDRERDYRVAVYQRLLEGIDNIEPLLAYKHVCPLSDAVHAGEDVGVGAKEAIVSHFSYEIWSRILHQLSIADMDANGDGLVTKAELKCAASAGSLSGTGELVIDNAFRAADTNSDGVLSKEELVRMAGLVVGREGLLQGSSSSILRRKRKAPEGEDGACLSASDIADQVRKILLGSELKPVASPGVIVKECDSTHEAINAMIRGLDANEDGVVSESEIKESEVRFVEASSKNVVI
jgi:Ca2+-binding EF-hand superfamily protein